MEKERLKYYLTKDAKDRGIKLVIPRKLDAGFDIQSLGEVMLPPHSQAMVDTGLHVAVPDGWVMIIKDRSGMAGKRRIYTHAGVIDAGYRGEVKIVLSNEGTEIQTIKQGEKIAQAVIVPCLTFGEEVESLEDLGDTERGDGGFGSTGV